MQATELIIESKVKPEPFAIVSPHDFETQAGVVIDPSIILEASNISLYCLDHENRQAIFVETDPEVDLIAEPFYFIAQYEHAQRLISVPYRTFHELASKVTVDPEKIILFYSTGRCGSTLFSHVMNINKKVISFSEPDIFSQLIILHTKRASSDGEIADLLRSSVMVMSENGKAQGFDFFAFKFRSYVLSVSDLLLKKIPNAKIIFLYRNALTWARSFSRAFGAANDTELNNMLFEGNFRYMIPSVYAHLEANGQSINWIEYIAHMWVSTMQDIRLLKQNGARVGIGRFEDLKTNPTPVIQTLLAHCEMPIPSQQQLEQVLASDSQAGTQGAQDKSKPARWLTDADLRELDKVIHHLDSTLAPDVTL